MDRIMSAHLVDLSPNALSIHDFASQHTGYPVFTDAKGWPNNKKKKASFRREQAHVNKTKL